MKLQFSRPLVLAALAACSVSAPPDRPGGTDSGALLPVARVLEIASRTRSIPARFRSPEMVEALLGHVRRGGGILLRGAALDLVRDLGLTTRAARAQVVTRGFDGAADRRESVGLVYTQAGAEALDTQDQALTIGSTPLMRVEIHAFERMDLREGGEVFAEAFTKNEGVMKVDSRAVLCGWRVGAGRVLALGVQSDTGVLPAGCRERFLRWLAGDGSSGGGGAIECATLLDLPPRPELEAWGPRARARVAHGAAPVLRVPASFADGVGAESRLVRAARAGFGTVVLEDDGEGRSRFVERRARVRAHGMRFGIASARVRDVIADMLEQGVDGADPLALLVLAATAGGAIDGAALRAAYANGVTQVWTPRPARGPGACATAYVPADAGRPRGEATPAPPVRELGRFPPALYGVLEIDARASRGAWIDSVRERAAAFTSGRPGATLMLRVPSGRDEAAFEHAFALARVLRDPMREAASYRLVAGGPAGFERARAGLDRSEDGAGDARAQREQVLRTAPDCLANRWLRLVDTRLEVDPRGVGRFGGVPSARVTESWGRGELRGVRIGDPDVLAQLLTPLDARLGDFDLSAGEGVDGRIDFERGRYVARFKVEARGEAALLQFVDPSGRSAFASLGSDDARELAVAFESGAEVTDSFSMRLLRGARVRVRDMRVRGAGVESALALGKAHSGELAVRVRDARSGYLLTRETSVTRGELPGLVQVLEFRKSRPGLRLEHRLDFEGYRLAAVDGGLVLESESRPELELRLLDLGRLRLSIEDDACVLTGHPRAWERVTYALVLPDALPAGLDRRELDRALARLAVEATRDPVAAAPGGGRAEKAIADCPLRLAPGSQGLVDLLSGGATWAELRVRASVARQPRPGVRFEGAVPRAFLRKTDEGPRAAWLYMDDETLWLPRSAGRYRLEWQPKQRTRGPRLVATRASIEACHYDADSREFVIDVRAPGSHAPGTSYVLRVRAPTPVHVSGAAVLGGGGGRDLVLSAPPGRVRLRL